MFSKLARRSVSALSKRHYNFASTSYKECFGGLPVADGSGRMSQRVADASPMR